MIPVDLDPEPSLSLPDEFGDCLGDWENTWDDGVEMEEPCQLPPLSEMPPATEPPKPQPATTNGGYQPSVEEIRAQLQLWKDQLHEKGASPSRSVEECGGSFSDSGSSSGKGSVSPPPGSSCSSFSSRSEISEGALLQGPKAHRPTHRHSGAPLSPHTQANPFSQPPGREPCLGPSPQNPPQGDIPSTMEMGLGMGMGMGMGMQMGMGMGMGMCMGTNPLAALQQLDASSRNLPRKRKLSEISEDPAVRENIARERAKTNARMSREKKQMRMQLLEGSVQMLNSQLQQSATENAQLRARMEILERLAMRSHPELDLGRLDGSPSPSSNPSPSTTFSPSSPSDYPPSSNGSVVGESPLPWATPPGTTLTPLPAGPPPKKRRKIGIKEFPTGPGGPGSGRVVVYAFAVCFLCLFNTTFFSSVLPLSSRPAQSGMIWGKSSQCEGGRCYRARRGGGRRVLEDVDTMDYSEPNGFEDTDFGHRPDLANHASRHGPQIDISGARGRQDAGDGDTHYPRPKSPGANRDPRRNSEPLRV